MKMMIAVDGSEFAEWAVRMLAALSARPPDHVILLYVVDNAGLKSTARKHAGLSKRALAAMTTAGRQVLRRFEGLARTALQQAATKPRTKIETKLVQGPVAESIVKQANLRKVDLLVLGSRGLRDMQQYLLGSVSRKVSATASCSVLIVKRPPTELATVLVAADASRHARAACRFLQQSFLPEQAHVTVLSVVEPAITELGTRFLTPEQMDALAAPKREAALEVVHDLRDGFLREGYAVATEVQVDHVTESLLRRATALKADLLVAGSRGLTGTERVRLGSVSDTLLKYAPCSVLVVRSRRA